MNAAPHNTSNNESDQYLKILNDILRIVRETHSDVKVLDRKMDRLEQKQASRKVHAGLCNQTCGDTS